MQSGSDLGLWQGAIGGEVDQAGFAFVDGLQASAQVGVVLPCAGLFVVERFLHQGAKLGGEVGGQLQRGVVVDDRFLDQFGAQVWQIAEAILTATAQEVGVAGAVTSHRFGVDQAGGSSSEVAALAEQRALEVALKNSIALAAGTARVQDVLHLIEQFLAAERSILSALSAERP